jgi:hypothetical protein
MVIDSEAFFGTSVSISGNTIVVGAIGEDSGSTEEDDSVTNSGAAYVFERSGGEWIQVAYLKGEKISLDNFPEEDEFSQCVWQPGGSR